MKHFVRRFAYQALGLLVPLALAAALLVPVCAFAIKDYSIGTGYTGGDPIDGNDFSDNGSGGGIDDIYQRVSSHFSSDGILVLPVLFDGSRIVLVPRFEAGVFMVRVVMLPRGQVQPEATHAD